MYAATAGVGSSLQSLKRFPDYQHNQLLILAGSELTIAYNLLEDRHKIWHNIFWQKVMQRPNSPSTKRWRALPSTQVHRLLMLANCSIDITTNTELTNAIEKLGAKLLCL
jgi:hypothetical protein